jgi:DegV family protein with EDD domain
MNKIIIVAESGSDITKETAMKYDINVVPMHVMMNNKSYDDGFFPVEKIFKYYDRHKKLPTSSATNSEEYRHMFEKINEENPNCQILHLCYSAVTTATYQNALIGSEGINNVTHIDTKSVSGGQGAVVLKTAKYIKKHPEATIEEVVAKLESWIKDVYMAFVPATLSYLLAGGRVSNAAYLGASMLKLKPVIEIDNGYLVSKRKYRGSMERACRKLIDDTLTTYTFEKETVFLLFSKGLLPEIKEEAQRMLAEKGYMNVPWVETGCVISVHGGPGAFGIGGFIIR